MTLNQFIDDVLRIQAILHTAEHDITMSSERRAGMTIVAEEWYRKMTRRATAKQQEWLTDNYPVDFRRWRR